jgi:DNA-binding SARP family transcriptional activator
MTDVVFRVLGSLEVEQGGQQVPVAPGKQRIVLAALLLQANRPVSIAELTETLWDGLPPADGRGTVQKYVMRLRRALAATGTVIHTESDGYRIEVLPGQLDLHRSDALVEQGIHAARGGDPEAAATHLAEALHLWRAVPPLMNVASPALHRTAVPKLVEQYLQALELRIDLDLQLGRHAALCGELIGLVRTYPLRERFWAQRMRALHATGRQGEALEAYREVTRLLADELGIDPGPELRAAHEEILRREKRTATATAGGRAVVRQLPMAPAGLVGREAEVEAITRALTDDGHHLVAVTGAPGMGKSAVALHAAHRLAEHYPDGQLFADLRTHGDGTAGPPADVDATLARFLRALGVASTALPRRRDEAVAMFRTLTADRSLLIVLDDAADPAQVRALLPGGTTSGVLVTSRHELAGLLVAPGALPVPLAPLDPGAAEDLLRHVAGADRVTARPATTAELLAVCGGLPLALRLAAARLATRPRLSLSAYLDEVRPDPLAALRTERDGAGVAGALTASYRRLGPDERRLLCLLGVAPAGEITVAVAAILAGRTRQATRAGLERLAEAGLLERRERGYQLHPLVGAFARERLVQDEPGDHGGRLPDVTDLPARPPPRRLDPVR